MIGRAGVIANMHKIKKKKLKDSSSDIELGSNG